MVNPVKILVLMFLVFYTSCSAFAQSPITLGIYHTLKSELLKEDIGISIYLPRSYVDSNRKRYDVLYVLDAGSNFIHTVGTQYFLAGYRQMPEIIIVGIHSRNRTRDFTPTIDRSIPGSGGADKFRKFIKTELFTFIESSYPNSDKKYLSGHSFGGLFALDTLTKAPEMFDAYFTFSPSMWWNNHKTLKAAIASLDNIKKPTYLYVTIGNEGPKLRRPISDLHSALKNNKNNKLKWKVDWLDKENHSTTPVIGQFLAYRDYFNK